MLPTSLRLGKRSKLVLVDPPSARCSASLSAGEGAKARKNELFVDVVADTACDPRPLGFKASYPEDPVLKVGADG
jgi:hypothetical protein